MWRKCRILLMRSWGRSSVRKTLFVVFLASCVISTICLIFKISSLHHEDKTIQEVARSFKFDKIVPAGGLRKYEPTWKSIDSRPLPAWYDEAKLGIFIHWGVFSVPGFGNEWFWYDWHNKITKPNVIQYMKDNYRPDFSYADFATDFTAEFYNPNEWADIFNSSGAQYIVLTSKHHEGFANWPSKYSFNWNSMDIGPKRDLVGELAAAIRQRTKIRFGLYYSLYEWYNPLWLQDKANNFSTNTFVTDKTMPELYEIVNAYKPEVVWSDGDKYAPDTYWQSKDFIAWLYNDSPVRDTVVTNDRWGKGILCHHGGFLTCKDRYNPGKLQKRKFEDAMTIDKQSWGYRRNTTMSEYLTIEELLKTFIQTVSCGGNMLMNVGPTKDGKIIPVFQERLRQMGDWLKVNGEAIYSSRPWTFQNDTYTEDVWYTSKKGATGTVVYAILLNFPKNSRLVLGAPMTSAATTVSMLGYQGNFMWQKMGSRGITIDIPAIPFDKIPTPWAWTLKLTDLVN